MRMAALVFSLIWLSACATASLDGAQTESGRPASFDWPRVDSAVFDEANGVFAVSLGPARSDVRRVYIAPIDSSGQAMLRRLDPANPYCHRSLTLSEIAPNAGEGLLFAVRSPCPTRYRAERDIQESLVAIDLETGEERVLYTANAKLRLAAVLPTRLGRDIVFMETTRASRRVPHSFDYFPSRYRIRIGRQRLGEAQIELSFSDDRYAATTSGIALPGGWFAMRVFENDDDPSAARLLTYDAETQSVDVLEPSAVRDLIAAMDAPERVRDRAINMVRRIADVPVFTLRPEQSSPAARRAARRLGDPNRTHFSHAPFVDEAGRYAVPTSPATGRPLRGQPWAGSLLGDRAYLYEVVSGAGEVRLYDRSWAGDELGLVQSFTPQ